MNIRVQIAAGLAAVVLIFAGTGYINIQSVYAQAPFLTDINLRATLVAEHSIHLLETAKDMQREVIQVQQYLSDISATRGQDGLDDGFAKAQEAAERFKAALSKAKAEAVALNLPAVTAELNGVETTFAPYYDGGLVMAKAYVAKGPAGGNPLMAGFDQAAEQMSAALEKMADSVEASTDASLDSLVGAARLVETSNAQVLKTMVVAGLLGLALAVVIGIMLGLRLSRLFSLLGGDVQTVLEERHDQPLHLSAKRTDEFGPIAKALEQFRANAVKILALQAEQAQAAEIAEQRRREALMTMADTVEVETAGAVEGVSVETERMRVLAQAMSASASRVGADSQGVAAAAEQSLRNAQAVAGAAEQLSASIREIGTQAVLSTQVVGEVVTSTQSTEETVVRLTDAMSRIGDVAKLIAAIADQTNLLALNATIEAARAGEAGKGFAVVAHEVKGLANQTARSTEEIAREVLELQTIGRQVAQAIGTITKSIDEISGVANSIAAAVEEQGAATQEIVRNIVQTSEAAEEVSRRIAQVASEAGNTGQRASQVQGQLDSIAERILDLRGNLNAVVRSAAPEVDRRRNPRIQMDGSAEITINGIAMAVRLTDISLCGSRMLEVPDLPEGNDGEIRVPGLDGVLRFSLIEASGGMMRVRFDETSAESARLANFIAGRHREIRQAAE